MSDNLSPQDNLKISNGIKHTLEALLFVSGKPLKAKDFAKILEQDEAAVKTALNALAEDRKNSGIVLLENNGEFQLSTNSKYSTQVKNFLNAELREKLTDATVEVLAIIAYRQPISKAEIEAIRGVNSQYSLRNLLMRGLIEKVTNPSDARSFLYQTTTELLMHLGMNSTADLPEFAKLTENIKLPQTAGLTQEAQAGEAATNEPTIEQPLPTPAPEPQVSEVADATTDSEEKEEEFEDDDEDEDDEEAEPAN